ncbi:MAG: hypothetical protein WCG49_04705 [Actinomycetes bacterium]
MRRIGRATIASAVVCGASLTTWILQRPSDPPPQNSIPWPDVSWVIVTTTSTLPKDKPREPEPTTADKPVSTISESTTSVDGSSTLPETQTTAVAETSPETSTTAVAAN